MFALTTTCSWRIPFNSPFNIFFNMNPSRVSYLWIHTHKYIHIHNHNYFGCTRLQSCLCFTSHTPAHSRTPVLFGCGMRNDLHTFCLRLYLRSEHQQIGKAGAEWRYEYIIYAGKFFKCAAVTFFERRAAGNRRCGNAQCNGCVKMVKY